MLSSKDLIQTDQRLQIRVARDRLGNPDQVQVLICAGDRGNRSVATNIEMTVVELGDQIRSTCTIDDIAAQALMDGLWDCGLRPTEGKGSAGQLMAVQNHLEDMRTIAFAGLRVNKDGK